MAREAAIDDQEMIYSPATRGNVGVLIMLAGPSGSGKTKSALRLAVGLANGGTIGFCDTEHGRARYYADDFEFKHLALKEPFSPARFEAAAVISQRAKHAVWICDSFSHEHVGPGGVLDMAEANLQRMTRGDFSKREGLKYTSWIEPKGEHKHLVQRMWQLNQHIILCCHAEKKLDLIKDKNGKFVPDPDRGLSPVCAPDIPYAMTVSYMLDAKRPGIPTRLKRFDKVDPLVSTEAVIDEDTGRRIAAWARGDKQAAKTQVQVSKPPLDRDGMEEVVPPAGQTAGKTEPENRQTGPENGQPSGPPPSDERFPGDIPLSELPLGGETAPRTQRKTVVVLEELIAAFEAVKVRADHLAIVDVKANRDRIAWIKKNKPDLHIRLDAAIKASWARTVSAPTTKDQAA
jgi:hypothetical protein